MAGVICTPPSKGALRNSLWSRLLPCLLVALIFYGGWAYFDASGLEPFMKMQENSCTMLAVYVLKRAARPPWALPRSVVVGVQKLQENFFSMLPLSF